jgi:hypothetical protein
MTLLKRLWLAALFAMVSAFLTATPVHAAGNAKLVSVGDEPGASGLAKLGKLTPIPYTYPTGNLIVTCSGLRPGATYTVYSAWADGSPRQFTASSRGTGRVEGLALVRTVLSPPPFPPSLSQVWVSVEREDGPDSSILVLRGIIYNN